jgi:hypothetical protein
VSGPTPYDPGPPLVADADGHAVVYDALGAVFHLEHLDVDDGARLDRVNQMVMEWFGSALAWTYTSVRADIDPCRPRDLDYIAGYPSTLATPAVDAPDEARRMAHRLAAAEHDEFAVFTHGARRRNEASPYSYRFFAEVAVPERVEPRFTTYSYLRFTVPRSCPLADFHARVVAIASTLRVRWGAAGLTYSGWELGNRQAYDQAVFVHARRFAGFDVGFYETRMDRLHHELRTVSWLTFVGPALLDRLVAVGLTPSSRGLLRVDALGDLTLLTAGGRPEEGDLNRLALPIAYLEADEAVRAIRAREGVDFHEPWSETTTAAWLTRFERRPS